MDEPLSNLDAKLRVVMRTELKAIHQRTGATSIFVTHDQSEAMSMADRIVIMKDGEIVQVGSPEDVYFRSADIFVAGFIGTPPTNFFPVSLERRGESLELVHPRFHVSLEAEDAARIGQRDARELILGVRPEDFSLVPKGTGILDAEVLVVEPQGSHQIVALEIEESIVKIIVPSERKLQPGEGISLDVHRSRLHFFDGETEKRI